MSHRLISLFAKAGLTALLLLAAANVHAAPLSYTGGVYSQDFNGLPTDVTNPVQTLTGKGPHELTAVTGAAGVAGWQFGNFGGSSANTEFRSHDGSLAGNAGRGIISFGTDGDTERALGSLPTGNQISTFGLVLKNDLAYTLTSFSLAYTGEQWRRGNVATPNVLEFSYQVGASAINGGGLWASVAALDFTAPITVGPTEVALDGNLAANQTALAATINGINWTPGSTLVLRWISADLSGQDDGLAIDNLSFSAVPEPSTFALAAIGLAGAACIGRFRRRRRG